MPYLVNGFTVDEKMYKELCALEVYYAQYGMSFDGTVPDLVDAIIQSGREGKRMKVLDEKGFRKEIRNLWRAVCLCLGISGMLLLLDLTWP